VNRTTGGVIGVVVVVVLVVALGAVALGGSQPASSPGPVGQVGTPTPSVATPSSTGMTSPPTSSSPTPSPSASLEPTPEPTPTTVPAPMTGSLVSPNVAARHPIAVMIDDLSPARPQSGLSDAAVVWHAPAEGGIPRYMAIFQDVIPKAIGPVRSSRYYYIAWAAEWRAIYAHAGGSPQAIDTLRAKGAGQWVYNIDEFRYSGTFTRVTNRYAPHNLYTTGKQLRNVGRNAGAADKAKTSAWQFAPDAPLEERPYGGTISVGYPANKIKYTYDRDTNTYRRSVTGQKKQTDAANGERIAPKNVIVMRMSFGPLNDGHPDKHRLEADVVGSGPAWISTNGRTIKGTWRKDGIKKPTRFYDRRGNEVTLTIGQTFIQVLTTSTSQYPASFTAGSDTPPA
jgi:Protein of unknown function (DUF3048) N-terminal domain/Protein of unknown function (DUF3048) C-terminal domain